jgi:hypothetical protein
LYATVPSCENFVASAQVFIIYYPSYRSLFYRSLFDEPPLLS